jgi:hypothetical protein
MAAEAGAVTALELVNRVGDVSVVGDSSVTRVVAKVTKVGKGVSPAEAEKALAEIEVSLGPEEGSPGTLLAKVDHPRSSSLRSWEVTWEITAPPQLNLKLRAGVGDVSIRNIEGDVGVASGVGDVEIHGVGGALEANSSVGDVVAEGLAGGARVATDVGDVRLELVRASESSISVTTDVGSVRVSLPDDQGGKLSVRTGVGGTHLEMESIPMDTIRVNDRHFVAHLNGAEEPDIDLRASVGDVTVTVR